VIPTRRAVSPGGFAGPGSPPPSPAPLLQKLDWRTIQQIKRDVAQVPNPPMMAKTLSRYTSLELLRV
jgi:hypothetical protein